MIYPEDQNLKIKDHSHSSKPKSLLKEKSYTFAIRMIQFIEQLPRSLSTDIISKQILRSATSVGANINESKSSSSRKDFINFLTYALKSANETEYWICLLRDSKKVAGNAADFLLEENRQICKMLGASLLTLKGKKEPGHL